jgi:hypothetical protein
MCKKLRKVWFLYVADGPAPTDLALPFTASNLQVIATNPFVGDVFKTEGMYYLLRCLVERRVIDACTVVVESTKGCGSATYGGNFSAIVIPQINLLKSMIQPEDVVFVRGGFRTWFPLLQWLHEKRQWIMFYRAATNRSPWPFWDLVLDDLRDKMEVGADGRVVVPFRKPVNPEVFYLSEGSNRPLDLCIGASHVHDKKGQWRVVDTVRAYADLFKEQLACVLPGGLYNGTRTNQIWKTIQEFNLQISLPGMLPREQLRQVYNASRLFVHFGGAGQNDRGVLEAMACGCFPVLGSPQYHAPFTYKAKAYTAVVSDPGDPVLSAKELRGILETVRQRGSIHDEIAAYYDLHSNVDDVSVLQMAAILDSMFFMSKSDRAYLATRMREYHEGRSKVVLQEVAD